MFMVAETKKEALIVKTTIHDIMNQMIRVIYLLYSETRVPWVHCSMFSYLSVGTLVMQELPITNPVYLMLNTSFGSSAKGTGLKALEFALSICDSVDMYGFTVDPGYKEWLVSVDFTC